MTTEETNKIIGIIKAEYFILFDKRNDNEKLIMLNTWSNFFKGYDYDFILQITYELIKRLDFPPKLKNYQDMIDNFNAYHAGELDIEKDDEINPNERFEYLEKFYKRHKKIDYSAFEIFNSLPFLLRKAIESVENLTYVFGSDITNFEYQNARTRFIKLYEELEKKEKDFGLKKKALGSLVSVKALVNVSPIKLEVK